MGRDNKGVKKVSVSLENGNRVNREEMPTNYGKSQVTGVAEADEKGFGEVAIEYLCQMFLENEDEDREQNTRSVMVSCSPPWGLVINGGWVMKPDWSGMKRERQTRKWA